MSTSREDAAVALHYVYPATVFLYFAIASGVAAFTRQIPKKDAGTEIRRRLNTRTTLSIFVFCLLTYAAQLITLATRSFLTRTWPSEEHIIIGHLSCILVFGILISSFTDVDAGRRMWYPFYGSWVLAIIFELPIFVLEAFDPYFWTPAKDGIVQTTFVTLRCFGFLSLFGFFFLHDELSQTEIASDEEQQSLLPKTPRSRHGSQDGQSHHSEGTGYGSTLHAERPSEDTDEETPMYSWEIAEREAEEAMEKRLQEDGNWLEYVKGFKVRGFVVSSSRR